jgi:hypothetical protein
MTTLKKPRGFAWPLRNWPAVAHLRIMADTEPPESHPKKPLTPAAERALAEAAERRARQQAQQPATKEVGGPSGPEPTRYGDWEKKGLTSDF